MSQHFSDAYEISRDEAFHEVGPEGIKKLKKLSSALYGKQKVPMTYRLAPSIVSRSEAELLARSIPRFAVRAYLEDTRQSFVNARRLSSFTTLGGVRFRSRKHPSKNKPWKHCDPGKYVLEEAPGRPANFEKQLSESPCVGDSLLVPPSALLTRFDVLTAELGAPMGKTAESTEPRT